MPPFSVSEQHKLLQIRTNQHPHKNIYSEYSDKYGSDQVHFVFLICYVHIFPVRNVPSLLTKQRPFTIP